jgi:hypothetical protein
MRRVTLILALCALFVGCGEKGKPASESAAESSGLRITAWNLQWFPGKTPSGGTAEEQAAPPPSPSREGVSKSGLEKEIPSNNRVSGHYEVQYLRYLCALLFKNNRRPAPPNPYPPIAFFAAANTSLGRGRMR